MKESQARTTRIRALDQLHRGDEVEARLRVGPDYDDVVVRRGRVQDTAPGTGVVWILDRQTGTRRAVTTDECTLWRVA
ncbi:hypothetical protein ACTWLI_06320 [Arthrobacter sp. Hor0625]|uniref:hypothetical protein n=1 Tax=Arthrobacter sp. Hor0625 TaxID=3457358 RepID=UPI00403EC096